MISLIIFKAALLFLLWARFSYKPKPPLVAPQGRLQWHDRRRYWHRFETWRLRKTWCNQVTANRLQIS